MEKQRNPLPDLQKIVQLKEFKNNRKFWNMISRMEYLSPEFICEHAEKVNWKYLSIHQNLTDEIIQQFSDKLKWEYISAFQVLSDEVIRQFSHKLNWCLMSKYQNLSETILCEFSEHLDWYDISKYQHLSPEMIEKFQDRLNLKLLKENWWYLPADEKKAQILKTGLYACYDDYFIAYIGLCEDGYDGKFFKFRYEPGGIYEKFADGSCEKKSFGFSVSTYDQLTMKRTPLIVQCQIRYEDIARIVKNGKMIRCGKITVLE